MFKICVLKQLRRFMFCFQMHNVNPGTLMQTLLSITLGDQERQPIQSVDFSYPNK